MTERLLKYRRAIIVTVQLALVVLANFLAFWIRFEGRIPFEYLDLSEQMLPWLVLVRGLMFVPFGLYQGLWRYASIWDLRNIIASVVCSTFVFYLLVHYVLEQGLSYPRSIFIVDALLLTFFLGGIRLGRRIYKELGHLTCEKKVLIYGAGDAGEMIVRDMRNSTSFDYEPVGFVDDDSRKVGQRIHGVRVLGTGKDLREIMERVKPSEILVAMPSLGPAALRRLVTVLETLDLPIKTLPSVRDVLDDTVTVNMIRNLSLEDLLPRAPVGLDPEAVRRFLSGKRIVVTGAGGSIGSELARQIARYEPELLVLLDKAESALCDIDMELSGQLPQANRQACLADVCHADRIDSIFARYTPHVVFHTAAYKHVPILEVHPVEAVLNNIVGSRRLGDVAALHGVEKFIQISTDKAVNPTSIMGATKRVSELYLQAIAQNRRYGRTTFGVVRFGNVLGSNGSVVPLFLRQIQEGGPVTVTDPEVRRFFMTIPEAVQLVLQAGPLARDGDILVLDMGEQIKILDMARYLIRFSGYTPEEDIPVVFTGLRLGEKLFEELVGADEAVEPSETEQIQRVHPKWQPEYSTLTRQIDELERLALRGDQRGVVELLREMVPTYRRPVSGYRSPASGSWPSAQPVTLGSAALAVKVR